MFIMLCLIWKQVERLGRNGENNPSSEKRTTPDATESERCVVTHPFYGCIVYRLCIACMPWSNWSIKMPMAGIALLSSLSNRQNKHLSCFLATFSFGELHFGSRGQIGWRRISCYLSLQKLPGSKVADFNAKYLFKFIQGSHWKKFFLCL